MSCFIKNLPTPLACCLRDNGVPEEFYVVVEVIPHLLKEIEAVEVISPGNQNRRGFSCTMLPLRGPVALLSRKRNSGPARFLIGDVLLNNVLHMQESLWGSPHQ